MSDYECNIQRAIEYRLRHGIMLPPETPVVLHGYKDPLTPVQGGFGYIGTLAYNEEKTHVQCHLCGYFFKSLGHHVTKSHAMTTGDYRDRTSLMRRTSLASPAFIDNLRERAAEHPVQPNPGNSSTVRMKAGLIKNTGRKRTLEQLNRLGRCPEQLLHKISVLAERLGRTPTRRDFIRAHGDNGDLNMIYITFGGWNPAVQIAGLAVNRPGRK